MKRVKGTKNFKRRIGFNGLLLKQDDRAQLSHAADRSDNNKRTDEWKK
ncbi:hypothetical protein ACTG4T_04115 [Enterococcus faecium]